MRCKPTALYTYHHIGSLVLLALSIIPLPIRCETVSPELRKLAKSTNQFGIDALRALDKIEPANKVLVYSPICLSSSLAMIMMGSSKYHVVSALRQALYVWSMQPQEINKGFKDMFDYIGFNQASTPVSSGRRSKLYPRAGDPYQDIDSISADYLLADEDRFSLPKLIKWREFLERQEAAHQARLIVSQGSLRKQSRWSQQHQQQQDVGGKDQHNWHVNTGGHNSTNSTAMKETLAKEKNLDSSFMSALSNIYMQRGLMMNYQYNLMLRKFYRTVVHPVDFIRRTEETRQHINSLVSAGTEGKIRDLIKKSNSLLGLPPRLMLVSAFHFRGTLDLQMLPKSPQTRQQRSPQNASSATTIYNNNTIQSKSSINSSSSNNNKKTTNSSIDSNLEKKVFIHSRASLLKFGHFASMDCSLIEIPFNNRLVSLVIMMPNEQNLTELTLTKLNARNLADMVASLQVGLISLEIPLIRFDRGPINVGGLMRELGLEHLFLGERLNPMAPTSETGLNKWLRLSDLVHESSIDIGTYTSVAGPSKTAGKTPNESVDTSTSMSSTSFESNNLIQDRLTPAAHKQNGTQSSIISRDTNNSSNNDNDQKKKIKKLDRRARNLTTTNKQQQHIRLDKPFFYFVMDTINGLILSMGRVRS